MKILILGSSGLVGHQLYNYLNKYENIKLLGLSHKYKINEDTKLVNLRDEKSFLQVINNFKPNHIINCAGVLIENSNKDPELAIYINSYIPHRIARLCDEIDAKLTHISTDCVFSGDNQNQYIELDYKDGKDIYAKTKGLGEVINDKDLTIRTSVVGPELKSDGKELFNWFMRQNGTINGYTKRIWSGISTLELSKGVKWSIDNNITGLYHLTNNKTISKYELLNLFKKYTNKVININPASGLIIDKSFKDTRKIMNYSIPSYEKMIYEMTKYICENSNLYPHYKFNYND